MVGDPDVDIVVEVIGGIEPARSLIIDALMAGKPVVTANKELLGTHGRSLFETAEGAGVDFLFEASVAGGIPLMRPLRESLAGDRIRRVMGIVNGTTNFILTRMSDDGQGFDDALAEAQELGFAESDPTADVEGFDAAAKCGDHRFDRVRRPGHRRRRPPRRHHRASRSTTSRRHATSATSSSCSRSPRSSTAKSRCASTRRWSRSAIRLAAVRDSFNAVFIEGDAVGELMLYGRGAGGGPTASAVLGRSRRRGEEPGGGAQGRDRRRAGGEADPPDRRGRHRSSTS